VAGERRRDDRRENKGRGLPRPRAEEDPTIDGFAPRGDADGSLPRLDGGGTLERLYAGTEPRLDPTATELPPLPPLSSADPPRENTWPIPEREETTLADEPSPPPKPRRAPLSLADSFDEVPPGAGGTDGLLGPIDEFTLSMGTDPAQLDELSDPLPPQPPPPARSFEAPPRQPSRAPAPQVSIGDPLTTGVVDVPEELRRPEPKPAPRSAPPAPAPTRARTPAPAPARQPRSAPPAPPAGPTPLSDATAALMLDGLDELPLAEPSLGLPEVQMPAPDTSRARGWSPPQGPPAISLDPRSSLELDDSGDVEVMEASPAVASNRPPPAPTPRPAPPRPSSAEPPAEVRPPSRSAPPPRNRPEARPGADAAHPATSAVELPRRGSPSLAPPPPPRRGDQPMSVPVGGLDQLLSLADEPPEREETIGTSLELLRLVDAPPAGEETLGASLERLEPPPVPQHVRPRGETPPPPPPRPAPLEPLPSVHDESPVGEETIGSDMVLMSSLETRPISHADLAGDPATAALAGPPPGHRPLQSAQLRRETWRPPGTPDPPASGPGASAPAARRAAAPPPAPEPERAAPRPPRSEAPEDGGGSVFQDPVVLGAASVIGLLLFVAAWMVLFLVLAWIV
jgi:hypothetical protein